MIDLIGYTLKNAKKVLEINGYKNIIITKTTSPRNRDKAIDEDKARVVKLTDMGNHIDILVCI